MMIVNVDQGGEAWFRARAGVITASMVSTIRAKVGGLTEQQAKYVQAVKSGMSSADAMAAAGYKSAPRAEAIEKAIAGLPVGDWSDASKNYAFRLAIERLSKAPLGDDGYHPWQAERGIALEEDARRELELRIGDMVEPAGFVMTEDRLFGASADGLVGSDAGAEFKCYLSPSKLRPILLDGSTDDVRDQCQMGMAITGRRRWYFGLYLPALRCIGRDFTMMVIERDDDYIDAMWLDLLDFNCLVEKYVADLMSGSEK